MSSAKAIKPCRSYHEAGKPYTHMRHSSPNATLECPGLSEYGLTVIVGVIIFELRESRIVKKPLWIQLFFPPSHDKHPYYAISYTSLRLGYDYVPCSYCRATSLGYELSCCDSSFESLWRNVSVKFCASACLCLSHDTKAKKLAFSGALSFGTVVMEDTCRSVNFATVGYRTRQSKQLAVTARNVYLDDLIEDSHMVKIRDPYDSSGGVSASQRNSSCSSMS